MTDADKITAVKDLDTLAKPIWTKYLADSEKGGGSVEDYEALLQINQKRMRLLFDLPTPKDAPSNL